MQRPISVFSSNLRSNTIHMACTSTFNDQYTVVKRLSKAIYGHVALIASVADPQKKFAAKVLDLAKIKRATEKGKMIEDPMNEIITMELLRDVGGHPHLLSACPEACQFRNDKFIYLVSPLADGGELWTMMNGIRESDGPPFSEDQSREYFKHMVLGVQVRHLKKKTISPKLINPE